MVFRVKKRYTNEQKVTYKTKVLKVFHSLFIYIYIHISLLGMAWRMASAMCSMAKWKFLFHIYHDYRTIRTEFGCGWVCEEAVMQEVRGDGGAAAGVSKPYMRKEKHTHRRYFIVVRMRFPNNNFGLLTLSKSAILEAISFLQILTKLNDLNSQWYLVKEYYQTLWTDFGLRQCAQCD